ncbi:flagellar biosynthetic protein FliR [Aquipuribacter nitratireducens]|uniref:Flagellar biosynthetic protein FliR n=1 Tax=Aquipuribacter nitratireducens TaxID=650104 RepID=A0ABW0GNG6_9MICO
MVVDVPSETLAALLLGMLRVVGWLVVAPPFSGRAVPAPLKALLAVGLTLPVLPAVRADLPPLEPGPFAAAAVVQLLTGLGLGFVAFLLFQAFRTAGDLVDNLGGFALATAFDPTNQTQASVIGRFQGMLAGALLLVTDGWLVVWHGFFRSWEVLPVDAAFDARAFAVAATDGLGQMLLLGVQIAAPMLAVLFVADVGLGLATRIAPQLNAFATAFPVKILLTLTLVGYTFVAMPGAVTSTADTIGATLLQVAG